jgi:hypothetical protein
MPPKYYTVEEANRQLPLVDQILHTLQDLKQQFEQQYLDLRRKKQMKSGAEHGTTDDPYFMIEARLEFIQIEAKAQLEALHNQGIELKDIDIGLVDFPAIIDGVEVLLCWRQGEEHISYYHSREDGFSGRKPLE